MEKTYIYNIYIKYKYIIYIFYLVCLLYVFKCLLEKEKKRKEDDWR